MSNSITKINQGKANFTDTTFYSQPNTIFKAEMSLKFPIIDGQFYEFKKNFLIVVLNCSMGNFY